MTGNRTKTIAAFGAVYIFWGSTYLFIKYTIESFPPLGIAGLRFLLAGIILCLIGWWRGAERPRPEHWRSATIVGVLLMTSNAGVAWSETRIPSGVASLLVAMTPCWMVLFDWAGSHGKRPHGGVLVGLVVGVLGVAILIGPGQLLGGGHIDATAGAVLLVGSGMWAFGSLHARRAPRPASPQLLSGMQMMTGGAALSVFSLLTNQWSGFSLADASAKSIWSFFYLLTFGSLIAFSAYMYLLTVTTPARVSTYAYVNPVVAVLLGWLFAREQLTPRMAVAAAVIVGAVALIVTFGAEAAPLRVSVRTDEFPVATTDSA